ncbi:MAG TPA: trypsin-like peptidase domain-containing protein [Gemmatimonadaceae bacterium]|jgi:S1-C subfamily serine protease|nr:trypsin-like peptidase domain-containing protein [Gemmatimonadaceae bacterium]
MGPSDRHGAVDDHIALMAIELRILGGARAGQSESFEKSVIAIGRHPLSDLRFDATHDLDVSARHGEIRAIDDSGRRYAIFDDHSTNGTFVNGKRVLPGTSHELRDGDVIALGPQGPTVSVHLATNHTTPFGRRPGRAEKAPPPMGPTATEAPGEARTPTNERVAMAVAEQTRGLKVAVGAAIVVLAALAGFAYWAGHREAAAADEKLRAVMTTYEQSSKALEAKLQNNGNATAVIDNLQRQRDSLVRLAHEARGAQTSVVQQALERQESATRALTRLDPVSISKANNGAVALIHAEFGGLSALEATGFAVATTGRLVTNRHVVETNGTKATRILVKFADTERWRRAHVEREPDDANVDLALLQLDDAGDVPAVTGVAAAVGAPVGAPIVSIGFPEGSDLPMNGDKAATSLTVGIVSKIVPEVLQIDSYASHGSSGSPVFDSRGRVIGVIYGGEKQSNGRIVYAVPAAHVLELMR